MEDVSYFSLPTYIKNHNINQTVFHLSKLQITTELWFNSDQHVHYQMIRVVVYQYASGLHIYPTVMVHPN